MIDFIAGEAKKMIFNCLEREAKVYGGDVTRVQLILSLKGEANNYTVCLDYSPIKDLDIYGVLGVRIDFKGYSKIAPPFIAKSLARFAIKHKIGIGDVKVMCLGSRDGKKTDVQLFLYEGMTRYIETITWSDLFSEEDFEMPTV